MKKITTLNELMEVLEDAEYNYYGLRGASKHDLEIVDRGYLDCSQDLCDRRDCDYDEDAADLNGTCAIAVSEYDSEKELKKCYEMAKGYATNHHGTGVVYLVAGRRSEYGEDECEIIINTNGYGADVLAIVEL